MIVRLTCVGLFAVAVAAGVAQPRQPAAPAPPPAVAPRPETPPDALGRDTPRGALLGFLSAARKGDNELARYYLDTRLPAARRRISPISCSSSSTPGCRRG